MERMLTVRQLAAALGVHPNWVYERANSGELPSYKIGGARRFLPSEIAAWLQTRHAAASEGSADATPEGAGHRAGTAGAMIASTTKPNARSLL
jgi:excisionase family DNA binding protein